MQIASNPQYAKTPSPSTSINNPVSGQPSFGVFPAINTPQVSFVGGPIYLRYGKHWGPKSGYGLEHIWKARFPKVASQALVTPLVCGLITQILVGGATIHYEYNLGSADRRATVFRNANGVVIVEERTDGRNQKFYSIVTAIKTSNPHGAIIGQM